MLQYKYTIKEGGFVKLSMAREHQVCAICGSKESVAVLDIEDGNEMVGLDRKERIPRLPLCKNCRIDLQTLLVKSADESNVINARRFYVGDSSGNMILDVCKIDGQPKMLYGKIVDVNSLQFRRNAVTLLSSAQDLFPGQDFEIKEFNSHEN